MQAALAAAQEPASVILGETFPIAEPDTLEEIRSAAGKRDWRQWMQRDPAEYSAFRSVTLPRATRDDSRLFDPTYSIPRDIVDDKGRLFFAKGTKVNVYERIRLPGRYIVISPEPADYRWLDEVAKPTSSDKLLLASGNVLKVRQTTGREVYLLDAHFTERLGLKAVPAIVSQEGTMLRVNEYTLARSSVVAKGATP